METIGYLDREVFLLINHLPHTVMTDQIALFLSAVGRWGLLWFVIAAVLFFREEKKDHLLFVPSVLVLLGTVLCEFFLKALIARPRPDSGMGALIIGAADNFSFPSSHATFAFAYMYILSWEEPRLRPWLLILAIFVSLSRVYLGVHYPLDIVGGGLLGYGIGFVAEKITPRRKNKKHIRPKAKEFSSVRR